MESGSGVRWAADPLGHADPALTLRAYAHAMVPPTKRRRERFRLSLECRSLLVVEIVEWQTGRQTK